MGGDTVCVKVCRSDIYGNASEKEDPERAASEKKITELQTPAAEFGNYFPEGI